MKSNPFAQALRTSRRGVACHCSPTTALGLILALCILMTLASCAPAATPQPTPTKPLAFADPFAYCAAVGTMDTPDARYTGPAMPDSVIQAMVAQGIVSADAPPEFQKNAVWRCMDGKVWVCHYGANLPCLEKADTSQVPTSEMEQFCTENPAADVIPAYVTGRATVYEWKCQDGKPVVVSQIFAVDPQGYLADFWYELTPK
ncbi:MAG: hypothetical protein ACP5Q1_05700 [Anaerolineae bacterium]